MATILVTGGVRSGKSAWAEALLAGRKVAYITPGYPVDPQTDLQWAARVQAHRERRPRDWTTVETVAVAAALADTDSDVLIDCLGTWVSRLCDDLDAWNQPETAWRLDFDAEVDRLVTAWRAVNHPERLVVAVTNEVGWGVVPETPAGRLFTDLLGRVNQAVAAVSNRVVLLVAGRAIELP